MTSYETRLCKEVNRFFFFFFQTLSHYVAQAGLELVVTLSQPFKCWDYRYALPPLAYILCSL
jgi:hypothetical protein